MGLYFAYGNDALKIGYYFAFIKNEVKRAIRQGSCLVGTPWEGFHFGFYERTEVEKRTYQTWPLLIVKPFYFGLYIKTEVEIPLSTSVFIYKPKWRLPHRCTNQTQPSSYCSIYFVFYESEVVAYFF